MDPTPEIVVRWRLDGRVQGVGFRYHTRRAATRLGIRGWVRNLADGGVEILAAGPPERVARLREAVARGPDGSSVRSIEDRAPGPAAAGAGFEIVD